MHVSGHWEAGSEPLDLQAIWRRAEPDAEPDNDGQLSVHGQLSAGSATGRARCDGSIWRDLELAWRVNEGLFAKGTSS
jgi:hypothetical protein